MTTHSTDPRQDARRGAEGVVSPAGPATPLAGGPDVPHAEAVPAGPAVTREVTPAGVALAEERAEGVIPNGPAAAAILAAGIGSFVLGVVIVLATASKGVERALAWSSAVGPLSGKSTVAVAAWLASWVVLHRMWRGEQVRLGVVYGVALGLIVLGLVGSFPPVFEAVGH